MKRQIRLKQKGDEMIKSPSQRILPSLKEDEVDLLKMQLQTLKEEKDRAERLRAQQELKNRELEKSYQKIKLQREEYIKQQPIGLSNMNIDDMMTVRKEDRLAIEQMTEELKSLKDHIIEKDRFMAQFERNRLADRSDIQSLKEQLRKAKDKDAIISQLKKEIKSYKEQFQQLTQREILIKKNYEKDIEIKNKSIALLTQQINALDKQVKAEKQKPKPDSQEIKKIFQLNKTISELNKNIQVFKQEILSSRNTIEKLTTQLMNIKDQLLIERKNVKSLEIQLQQAKQQETSPEFVQKALAAHRKDLMDKIESSNQEKERLLNIVKKLKQNIKNQINLK